MERILIERKKVLKAMVKDFIKKIRTPLLNGQLFRTYKISDEFLNEFTLKFRNDKKIVKNTIQEIIENKDMMCDFLSEKEHQGTVFGISSDFLKLALEENEKMIYSKSKDFIDKVKEILETEKSNHFSLKDFFEIANKKGILIYFFKEDTGRYNKIKKATELEKYFDEFLKEKITNEETERLKLELLKVLNFFEKMFFEHYRYIELRGTNMECTPYGLWELEEKYTLKYKIDLFLNDFENENFENIFGIKEVFKNLYDLDFTK